LNRRGAVQRRKTILDQTDSSPVNSLIFLPTRKNTKEKQKEKQKKKKQRKGRGEQRKKKEKNKKL
jgi:hypothetical protein